MNALMMAEAILSSSAFCHDRGSAGINGLWQALELTCQERLTFRMELQIKYISSMMLKLSILLIRKR